jgi:hypothetical protein
MDISTLGLVMVQIVKFDQLSCHRKDYTLANIYDAVGGAFQIVSYPYKVAYAFDVSWVRQHVSH